MKDLETERKHLIKIGVLAQLTQTSKAYKDSKHKFMVVGTKGRAFYNVEKNGFDSISETIPHSDIVALYAIIDGKFKELSVQDYLALYSSISL